MDQSHGPAGFNVQVSRLLLLALTVALIPQEVARCLADADCDQEVVIAALDGARAYGARSTDKEDV